MCIRHFRSLRIASEKVRFLFPSPIWEASYELQLLQMFKSDPDTRQMLHDLTIFVITIEIRANEHFANKICRKGLTLESFQRKRNHFKILFVQIH